AHLEDLEEVRGEGWIARFDEERAAHAHDPTWDDLAEHVYVALGTRVQDREALAGRIALETAIATSLSAGGRRQTGTGARLVRTGGGASARAPRPGGRWVPPRLPSDRALVLALVQATLAVARVTRVWRLGIRRRARGAEADAGEGWSLAPSLRAV